MRVITNNPVIVNNKRKTPNDWFLNADDKWDSGIKKTLSTKGADIDTNVSTGDAKQDKVKGKLFGNIKSAIGKAGETPTGQIVKSGWQNWLANKLGTNVPEQQPMIDTTTETKKKGMSKGLKIGLIVGGALLLTTVVVLLVRDKSPKK